MRERIRQGLPRILFVLGITALLALASAIVGGYLFGWEWTGVYTRPKDDTAEPAKTLWDWMSLLIVPLVLAIGGYIYNRTEKNIEQQRIQERADLDQKRAEETQREAALQTYLDQMADLLLKDLRSSKIGSEVRDIARIRTLTTLRRLDRARCTIVFRFLHDARLVNNTPESIVNLEEADFSKLDLVGTYIGAVYLNKANLYRANLYRANLQGAELQGAYLLGAKLEGANLRDANLQGAYLLGAYLLGAELLGTYLLGATVTNEQLATCKTLRSATLPDDTKVPYDVDNPFR